MRTVVLPREPEDISLTTSNVVVLLRNMTDPIMSSPSFIKLRKPLYWGGGQSFLPAMVRYHPQPLLFSAQKNSHGFISFLMQLRIKPVAKTGRKKFLSFSSSCVVCSVSPLEKL